MQNESKRIKYKIKEDKSIKMNQKQPNLMTPLNLQAIFQFQMIHNFRNYVNTWTR